MAEDVWTRPCDSVIGTRCTRCGPPSCLRRAQASAPFTVSMTSLKPPMGEGSLDSSSIFRPVRSA